MRDLIAADVTAGEFRMNRDPRGAVASLVGMVQYLAAVGGPILFAVTQLERESDLRDTMVHQTAGLFLRGLDVDH